MSLKQCCIIDNVGTYVDLFSVKTEQNSDGTTTENVLGYNFKDC